MLCEINKASWESMSKDTSSDAEQPVTFSLISGIVYFRLNFYKQMVLRKQASTISVMCSQVLL